MTIENTTNLPMSRLDIAKIEAAKAASKNDGIKTVGGRITDYLDLNLDLTKPIPAKTPIESFPIRTCAAKNSRRFIMDLKTPFKEIQLPIEQIVLDAIENKTIPEEVKDWYFVDSFFEDTRYHRIKLIPPGNWHNPNPLAARAIHYPRYVPAVLAEDHILLQPVP